MTDATKTEDVQDTTETTADDTTTADKLYEDADDTTTDDADDTDKGDKGDDDKGGEDGDKDDSKDDSKDDDSEEDEPDDEESEVPEKYDVELGDDTSLEESDLERIAAEARELGLSNEECQGLVDLEDRVTKQFQERQMDHVKEVRSTWIKEAETDKEIGGENFKENLELSKRVIDKFGSDDFKKLVTDTDFGNHKEVIRIFVRVGKLMGEDNLVHSNTPPGGKDKSPEEILFGDTQA